MSMKTPPEEQRERPDQLTGDAPSRLAARPIIRFPFRPAGAPVRSPAQTSPLRDERVAVSLNRRMEHLIKAAFINRNFAKLFWGQAISSVGDYAWDTALVLWIASHLAAGQSWAPLAVAGVILAAAIPQIVVGPIAGVFVDRWDKRRTMIIATALQALLAVGLIVAPGVIWRPFGGGLLSIGWRLGVVYADVALISSCSQFFLPAQLALIKGIVPKEKQ